MSSFGFKSNIKPLPWCVFSTKSIYITSFLELFPIVLLRIVSNCFTSSFTIYLCQHPHDIIAPDSVRGTRIGSVWVTFTGLGYTFLFDVKIKDDKEDRCYAISFTESTRVLEGLRIKHKKKNKERTARRLLWCSYKRPFLQDGIFFPRCLYCGGTCCFKCFLKVVF